MACVNDESRLSFSAKSSGRYLSPFSIFSLKTGEAVSLQKVENPEKLQDKKYPSYVTKERRVSAAGTALRMWLPVRFCDGLHRYVLFKRPGSLLFAAALDWN